MATTSEQLLASFASLRQEFAVLKREFTDLKQTFANLLVSFAGLRTEFEKHRADSAERDRAATERLTQIATDNSKQNQATVEKLAELKTEMANRDKEMVKWFVGVSFALFLSITAAVGILLEYRDNNPTPVQTSAPAPIIIYPSTAYQPSVE